MGLSLVEAPDVSPVDRATVKAHLHVEHSDDDSLIDIYIAAETAFAESFTGRALVAQTWDFVRDGFPAQCDPQEITLPLSNVLSVDAVYYRDTAGVEQTLDTANYDTDLSGTYARIVFNGVASLPSTWDGANGVRIRFTAGSLDTGASPATPDVMKDIVLAIMLRVQADYDGGDDAEALRVASEIYLKRRRVTVSLG